VLNPATFLKEKRDGRSKGTVRRKQKQRDYISVDVIANRSKPPRASSMRKRRDVGVIDIPDAFIQTHRRRKDMAFIKIQSEYGLQ
jgi:predicted metal-dependent hydrolase